MTLKLNKQINSRLQKGGALLDDMRMLVQRWSEPPPALSEIHSILGKQTLARSKDTFMRAFRPRFIEGAPKESWKLCRAIEECNPEMQSIRALYYYLTAKSELLLYRYATEEIYSLFIQGIWDISSKDTVSWLDRELKEISLEWTDTIKEKVARGLLAALRDFALLEGRSMKRIAPPSMAPNTASLIAWIMHEYYQVSGGALKEHLDWKLFLLSDTAVERLFLEAHQHGYLHFQSAGSTVRIEFPTQDLNAYARQLFS